MKRPDGRLPSQLRKIKLTRGTMKFAEASCLVEWGNTHVICTATVQDRVPLFLKNTATGWVTGEYGMLPRSSAQRIERESIKGRLGGRTQEIQRLIGRSLRSVVDLSRLGERSIIIDCDVIQADGGTRTAAITGAFMALYQCFKRMVDENKMKEIPLTEFLAAVSVGVVDGTSLLDLDFREDSNADVDMNVVMTGSGRIIEIQGTAEGDPFTEEELGGMLTLARKGISELIAMQRRCLTSG